MLHPVGPLPPSVYWRRRIAVAVAVLLVLVLAWLPFRGGADPQHAAAVPSGPTPSTAPATPSVPPSTSLAGPPVAAPSATGDQGPAAGGSADPDGTPAGTGNPGGAAPSGGAPAGGAGVTGVGAAAPQPQCADSALRVAVAPAAAQYRIGASPVVALSVQNVSRTACVRDLGARQQEVLLYAGGARLWSSNDCYPGGYADVRTVRPGERLRYEVTWSGLSSRPACAGQRNRVGAGRYRLTGRIGTAVSATPGILLLR